jgi:LysW-gamma-L-lysine carboxypeptidase
VRLEVDDGEVAVRGPRDGVLARAFRVAIRAEGGAPSVKVKTGTSDWNVLAPVWDVEALAYGPGDANLDHTPEERLPLEDFDRAVAVLTTVLERLASDVGTIAAPRPSSDPSV